LDHSIREIVAMPNYHFKCRDCRVETNVNCAYDSLPSRAPTACMACGGTHMGRVFGFRGTQVQQEHVNPMTGLPASTNQQARDDLMRKVEADAARTGYEPKLEFIPMADAISDPRLVGVNDDAGLKETHDTKVRTGQVDATPKHL